MQLRISARKDRMHKRVQKQEKQKEKQKEIRKQQRAMNMQILQTRFVFGIHSIVRTTKIFEIHNVDKQNEKKILKYFSCCESSLKSSSITIIITYAKKESILSVKEISRKYHKSLFVM